MAASPFVGSWQIDEIFNESMEQLTLPSGTYMFHINETDSPDTLRLGIKVGNSMSTKIMLQGGDNYSENVRFGGLMSTMMMPSEDKFKLESYLSSTLPKISLITVSASGDTLTMEGGGKIVCSYQRTGAQ